MYEHPRVCISTFDMHDKSFICCRCHILHAHCNVLFTAVLWVPVSCRILPRTMFWGMALNERDFNFVPDIMMTVVVGRRELQLKVASCYTYN
jgi:hypothetical protein